MRLHTISKKLIFALLLINAIVWAGSVQAGILTEVIVNKSLLVNLNKPAERISLANPAIADLISISPQQLQLNGLAVGSTSMIVWEKGSAKPTFFDVNVISDMTLLEPQIKEITPKDDITVSFAKDTVILSGKAKNQQVIDKVVQIAKAYAPNVLNHIRINDAQQVLLQVKVAQVDKTAMRNLGVSFMVKNLNAEGFSNLVGVPSGAAINSTSSSGGTTSTNATGIAGNIPGLGSYNPLDAYTMGISHFPSGVGVVLRALATKNLAKILAEPNMVVKSGEKGDFLAGSKIPYPVVTSTGGTATTSIIFQEVGVKLNFSPMVLENGSIQLKIDPAEVSTLNGTLAVNGYPIIDTRNIRTNVELKDGESLVLAGLLSEDNIKTMSKVPLLGDIPILGALFRSTSNELREKELVFFVTPKLITPLPPGTKVELPTDKQPTPEQERELQWIPTTN